jgi:uncharacterized membrane protein YebE (DUF533 family)
MYNTKTLLGVAVVGVAGYYLYNNYKKAKAAPAPVAAAFSGGVEPRTQAYTGDNTTGDVMKKMVGLSGKRGMVGLSGKRGIAGNTEINTIAPQDSRFNYRGGAKSWTGNQQKSASSGWVRADGIAGQFYDTHSTNW